MATPAVVLVGWAPKTSWVAEDGLTTKLLEAGLVRVGAESLAARV